MTALYHSARYSTIPTTGGIYQIFCLANKKFYIGSAKNLHHRYQEHFSYLRCNTHVNPKLQNAYNKYGPDAFTFEILEYVLLPEMLTAREQWWLDKTQAVKKGFNILPTAGSTLGYKASSETRKKIGDAGRGRIFSSDHCARIAASNKGNPKRMGKIRSLESRQKQGDKLRGKPQGPHSADTLAKINAKAEKRMITLIFTDPLGQEHLIRGIKVFCREQGLDRSAIMRVARGQNPQHKGWKARFPDAEAS